VIPEGSSECSSFCDCKAEDMEGRVFRLTRLEIDEPEQFAQMLNTIWEGDLRNNILNVIFYVDEAKQGTGVAFKDLSITAGPGWRTPKMPYILPAEEGQPTPSAVEDYCLLEGLSVPLNLKPYHGHQCQMKSSEASALYFHSGPKDGPLVCAPANSPANNIPISNLKIRASFNEDCTAIQDAFLEGCITETAADRICMCPGAAGTCPLEIDADAPFTEDDLAGYCHSACGDKWISFGGIVRSFSLLPSCLTPDGERGYRVIGFFDAEAVPGQFNPVSSSDCTSHL
jgi:hypothetical protein